jgi:leucine-zipper-like transcriptional regulator 1
MHSVSDLTTFSRKTSGDVPPKLVVRIITLRAVSFRPFLFCLTGRVDHRSGRQSLPLCESSFPPSPHFVVRSYSTFQGGRLVTERRMVTDMYVFDLKTLVWERVVAPSDDCTPAQRYFHSADSCEYRLPLLCHPI